MVILPRLKRLVGPLVTGLRAGFLQWTRPLTSSLPLQTLADLGRSKSELVAENALLRQQLIILRRQVKRPACTKTDRVLLVLLARMVRTWKQTLFIVQPETLLGFHRELFRLVWKHKSKASSHQPKVAAQTIALPQADGEGQSPSSALKGFVENCYNWACGSASAASRRTCEEFAPTSHEGKSGARFCALTPHRSGPVIFYRSPICFFDRFLRSSSSN